MERSSIYLVLQIWALATSRVILLLFLTYFNARGAEGAEDAMLKVIDYSAEAIN